MLQAARRPVRAFLLLSKHTARQLASYRTRWQGGDLQLQALLGSTQSLANADNVPRCLHSAICQDSSCASMQQAILHCFDRARLELREQENLPDALLACCVLLHIACLPSTIRQIPQPMSGCTQGKSRLHKAD